MFKSILLSFLIATSAFAGSAVQTASNSGVPVPMGDWQSYTPTFTNMGTVTSPSMSWRRVGDSLQVRGTFIAGSGSAAEARMSLPSGLIISSGVPSLSSAGVGTSTTNVTQTFLALVSPSLSYITFGLINGGAAAGLNSRNGDSLYNNGATASIEFTVPISGWSSGGGNMPLLSLSDFTAEPGITDASFSAGFGTVTNVKAFSRRVGDSKELQILATCGTTAAGTASITLPNAINSGALTSDAYGSQLGFWNIGGTCSNMLAGGCTGYSFYDGSDTAKVYFAIGMTDTAYTKAPGNGVCNTGGHFATTIKFPVSGWTSTSSGSLTAPRSSIYLDTYAGYGSTNTKVPYFTNSSVKGSAISVTTNNSTSGATLTINEEGVYCVDFDINGASGAEAVAAIVKNGSGNYTTNASSLATSLRRAFASIGAVVTINHTPHAATCMNLIVGDTVNPQTDAGVPVTSAKANFTITKVSN